MVQGVAWVFPGCACPDFLPSLRDPAGPLQAGVWLWCRQFTGEGPRFPAGGALEPAREVARSALSSAEARTGGRILVPTLCPQSLRLGVAGPQASGLSEPEVAAVASMWRRRKPWVWGPPTCPKQFRGPALWAFPRVVLSVWWLRKTWYRS